MDDFDAAANTGCDYLIDACSSIGTIATKYADAFRVPLLRIDGPMAKYAAENFDRIGVLGTLATSVDPCVELIRSYAAQAGVRSMWKAPLPRAPWMPISAAIWKPAAS